MPKGLLDFFDSHWQQMNNVMLDFAKYLIRYKKPIAMYEQHIHYTQLFQDPISDKVSYIEAIDLVVVSWYAPILSAKCSKQNEALTLDSFKRHLEWPYMDIELKLTPECIEHFAN